VAIPAATLAPGASYGLVLRAAFAADPSAFSESTCAVSVLRRPLVAVISGGAALERSVSNTLVLDASASNDPDAGGGAATPLVFGWACSVTTPGAPAASCRTASGDPVTFNTTSVLVREPTRPNQ
jgi:hypothetical protein